MITPTRIPLDPLAIGLMLIVCAVLGIQQVALKSVAGDMSPVLQLAIRSGIAALLLGCVMWWRKERFALTDGTMLPGLSLGLLFSLEYLFLGEGLRHTSASRMVVFLYSAPLVSAAVLHFMRREERLATVQWAGVFIAFAGLTLAFLVAGDDSGGAMQSQLWGDFLGLMAGVAWGLSTVVVRTTSLATISATRTLMYQLVVAVVALLLAAAILDQTSFTLSGALLGSLLFQGIVVAFGSFLVWLLLLKRYVASELGVLLFMTPIFGVTFGVILLDEPVRGIFVVGAVMVMVGIVLVSTGKQLLKQLNRN